MQGDLVSIEPWDCEGIEPPWGWDNQRYPEVKSKQMARFKRLKIVPGSVGFVVSLDHRGTDDYDTHYVVIVDGKSLGVPIRFLNKVET